MKTLLVATTLFVALSSFVLMGGHTFAILLDSKEVTQQMVTGNTSIPKIVIGANESHELIIKYSECGRTVSGRKITAKDNNGKVLKEWKFDGTTSAFKDPMKLTVKDLVSLTGKSNGALKLFYSSNDFPEGQQVATIVI